MVENNTQRRSYSRAMPRMGFLLSHPPPPWSEKLLAQRVKQGSHQSCKEHKPFLREEMLDFVEKGFFTLLPWRLVKNLPGLWVSPLGIIPQRKR